MTKRFNFRGFCKAKSAFVLPRLYQNEKIFCRINESAGFLKN